MRCDLLNEPVKLPSVFPSRSKINLAKTSRPYGIRRVNSRESEMVIDSPIKLTDSPVDSSNTPDNASPAVTVTPKVTSFRVSSSELPAVDHS